MNHLNTDRDERVRQIRERRNALQLRHGDWPCQTVHNSRERAFQQYVLADIDYLLSLLDSQAAETFVGPCIGCGHNNYDAERKECKQRWMEGNYSVVCGCPCATHNSLANAATRMRDRCVEKVRELCDKWHAAFDTDATGNHDEKIYYARAAQEINTALQSLTLAEKEEKR